ncbi:ATP-dependent helicase [Corynebacterium coyleae]|uniref:ATP-dependent helicase n=1 Tax=Corynebacterium coyleae TaxID=53374 RepID=UPI002550D8D2|nr:ATP-dependent helicase [Corynebacterium coyleae]MDK8663643.1 ATP-dependent helicase [Corynebacterium coyleae]MDK8706521.1 ATP-dependent helicase [Corynebacterium coyleae]MDK8733445.1 ATP-dependent helicase [Corynebacterium coyleae]MDK8892641.1 ATP-dependent helicase [Corynebacterium coyleae]
MTGSILDRFHSQVAGWFQDVFAAPTAVQEQAWRAISDDENALVVAPTGSGKTLAAFLWALNSLVERAGQQALPIDGANTSTHGGVRVLYISPLKALGVDVENNLRAPLAGIARVAQRLGRDMPDISVGVRSGDTPQAERNRQVRKPPDILITTPESLYLMLTSKAAGMLRTVDTVIVDEIHALAGTKRGVHLALSLERLRRLAGDFQRIGLSATVRPIEAVANFLGPKTTIINPPGEKRWELDVRVPVDDMSDLPVPEDASTIGDAVFDDALDNDLDAPPPGATNSIWPHIERAIYDEVMAHRSTIVFVNSRRTAERLTSQLNELWAKEHDPEALSPQARRPPAQLMKSVDTAGHAATVIARAHHGSVSKDERAQTETMLKEGTLRAVVSTSSLELGIDMGAVDLVIQVESPPSVASGLQRVGRAGHTVGAVSEGTFYPKHRSDLVQTAVTVPRMRQGLIEELHTPRSPLDVLAQQTVAAVAVEDLDVDEWYDTVRRAWPYRDLAREVFDSVIDLVTGVYPSTDFAELRPRAILEGNVLKARPGAQRVAVTNAGTIPDRGMFGVFLLASSQEEGGKAPRRVGELDEEMVYESRVGDVFTLGASSWRIENITRDQVQVSPAPGRTGRLPFWTGDGLGRPYELGKAVGAFRREAKSALDESLDERARTNLLQYLDEQEEATGILPDEKTLVLERFTDELGDWRVVLHTPFGKGVNAAWALATGWRVAQETGMDAQAVAGDDGIVLRLPQGEGEPDGAIFQFDADEIADIVTEQVGNSALFASRFRECAARALLLPRRNPGKRAPLWQQRQRAEQLLDVARNYPSFPIILETVRECLQDVYDLPALQEVMRDINTRRVRIAEVTTDQPSPFASSLLFNYTGAFMYEGDTPLAEKRAAALSLDPSLLAKLLGTVELRELLDADIIAEVDASLRRVGRAETSEQFADTLRIVGPVPIDDLPTYTSVPLAALEQSLGARMMRVRIGGRDHVAQVLDAPLLRDGLGVPVPPGVAAQVQTIPDALAQLVGRWVRTRGPFVLRDLADAFGLAVGAAHAALMPLVDKEKVIEGRYRQGVEEQEYVAAEVLRIIRSRSLAAARAQTRPVSQSAYGRFLPSWSNVAPVGVTPALRGADGVYSVIEQLAGVRLPASAWESHIFPSRVGDYSPVMLDELTANGEVAIVGAGKAGARDPWIMLLPTDYAAQLMPQVEEPLLSLTQTQVMEKVRRGGGFLFGDLLEPSTTTEELREAMWDLVEAGFLAPDSFAPIRARLAGGKTAHRARRRPQRSRVRSGRTSFASTVPPDMVGRWSLTPILDDDPTRRSVALGESLLDRYGVVTRGSVVAEDILGGFALAYKTLSGFEESGKAMRGYLMEGLGASQFSTPATIDRLRGHQDTDDVVGWPSGARDPQVYVLAATDPANPYGAALPWPAQGPTRSAGAMVVLIDGLLAAHVTRGGRTMTTFFDFFPDGVGDPMPLVVDALTQAVRAGRMQPLSVEKLNGGPAFSLKDFGATVTHKGAKIGGRASAPPKRRGRSITEALGELDGAEEADGRPDLGGPADGLTFDD